VTEFQQSIEDFNAFCNSLNMTCCRTYLKELASFEANQPHVNIEAVYLYGANLQLLYEIRIATCGHFAFSRCTDFELFKDLLNVVLKKYQS